MADQLRVEGDVGNLVMGDLQVQTLVLQCTLPATRRCCCGAFVKVIEVPDLATTSEGTTPATGEVRTVAKHFA